MKPPLAAVWLLLHVVLLAGEVLMAWKVGAHAERWTHAVEVARRTQRGSI